MCLIDSKHQSSKESITYWTLILPEQISICKFIENNFEYMQIYNTMF